MHVILKHKFLANDHGCPGYTLVINGFANVRFQKRIIHLSPFIKVDICYLSLFHHLSPLSQALAV